ncbi:MAG: TolC family protein [Myxococcales bacterium]|nr:TolC family protein [Myxococcales bacterium]
MHRVAALSLVVLAVALMGDGGARADQAATAAWAADPVLAGLVADSLAARPELAAAAAEVRAQAARVPAAGALPDPMLQLGLQNDGFTSIELGTMETSFASIAVSQTLPWPGKRGLRTALAQSGVEQAARAVERLRLSTIADVERGYLRLRLVRERHALLDRQATLWARASEVARLVYASGQGSQADVLRARLEERRLGQRRLALAAEEAQAVHALNRLRGHPLDEPIATAGGLADAPAPGPIDEAAAIAFALAHSPELAAAATAVTATDRTVALARKAWYPDLTVAVGVMVRGVDLPPMWQVSIGGPLPIFAGRKQRRAVEEGQARGVAARLDVEAVAQVLRQRIHDRVTAQRALADTIALYRDGLLGLSQATADSTLAQYQVGKSSLVAVLEASTGVLADQDAYLSALAAAVRIDVAMRELSLVDDATVDAGAMSTGGMAGRATAPATARPSSTGAGAAPLDATPVSTSAGMGGM